MGVVLIPGTGSWDNLEGQLDWFHPQHAFAKMLQAEGVNLLFDEHLPFIWTTDLDGVPLLDRKRDTDWAAGGAALCYFAKMHGVEDSIDAIAHSHAIHVVLFAAAHHGIKFRKLITMGSPVRKDMMNLAKVARQNIKEWIHIHSDSSDRWQWLGTIFDGRLGVRREHPLADKNVFVPKVGHSELLRNSANYAVWKERGWIDFLKDWYSSRRG